ncbi:MAG: radical SAM protein [Myxococcales bacterium]|nr:radical SAM protein [Myxococcales bacterium]
MVTERRLDVVRSEFRPVYVVWELTLRCDQPCTHCGSRAGDARVDEWTADEAVAFVSELAAMGAREVALIGGEAYLHPGFLRIVRALRDHDIRAVMTTGARSIDATLATQMADAGLQGVSISVDGLEATHDLMRASRGSFAQAISAMGHLRRAGIAQISANTNFNRLNYRELEPLYDILREAGITSWQVQVTTPLGRAADRAAMILQPWDLLDLVPRIAALKERAFDEGVLIQPGNNLGYFGPEEFVLRSISPEHQDRWRGCPAGRFVMGVESDGAIKGCPSLQTKHYVQGNARRTPLSDLWNAPSGPITFTRARTVDELWGFCATCPFARECLGGCSFTAHALMGRPGNNPYCHYRARAMAAKGLRERLVPVEPAPGEPFDNGRFELIEEPMDATDADLALPKEKLVKIRRAKPGTVL